MRVGYYFAISTIGYRASRADLREAGIPVDLRVWDGMWHVFEYYDEIPEARDSLQQISDHLNRHFEGYE